MSYEKLTADKFLTSMKTGKYANLTGARRAIGKADWDAKEKDRVRGLAEKHFGGAASAPASPKTKSSPPPKAAVKVAAKKVAATVAATTPKRKGRPPGSGKKTAPARTATSKTAGAHPEDVEKRIEAALSRFENSSGNREIEEIHANMRAISSGIDSMVKVREAFPDADFSEIQLSVDLLTDMFRKLLAKVGGSEEAPISDKVPVATSNGSSNHIDTTEEAKTQGGFFASTHLS